MTRKQGERLERNETKKSIIEFILSNNGLVPEPKIRDHLKKEYSMTDQGNIREHLKKLKKERCIEKYQNKKKGLHNYWNIVKIENLTNIQSHFSEIKLNEYEKSLMIVLCESGRKINNFRDFKFYIQLFLSASLFDICIEDGIELLNSKAKKIYQQERGSHRNERINETTDKCHDAYIERNPELEISKETFKETMEKIAQNYIELFSKESFLEILKNEFPGLSKEILLKTLDEYFHRASKEIPNEIPSQITDEDLEMYMYHTIWWMRQEQLDFEASSSDLLFEHFYHHDIFRGIDSDNELEFAKKTKGNLLLYFESKDPISIKKREWILSDLNSASEIIAKSEKPLIFGKVYNNSEDAYQDLKKLLLPESRTVCTCSSSANR